MKAMGVGWVVLLCLDEFASLNCERTAAESGNVFCAKGGGPAGITAKYAALAVAVLLGVDAVWIDFDHFAVR